MTVKKAVAKVSSSEMMRVENSFKPHQENTKTINAESNAEEIGSSQGKVIPPMTAPTFQRSTQEIKLKLLMEGCL